MNKKHKNLELIPKITITPAHYAKIIRQNKHREASILLRHEAAQAANRSNYINEYDRLKGILSQNIAHSYMDVPRLLDRQKQIEKMFKDSFKTHMHELYGK